MPPLPFFNFPYYSYRRPYNYYSKYNPIHKENIYNKPYFPKENLKEQALIDTVKTENAKYENADKDDFKHNNSKCDSSTEKKYSENRKSTDSNSSEYFFELFGLHLYFDDILLICLIFFLYKEGVQDEELFISLILLLIS